MPTYIRLTNYKSSEEKEKGFFKPENRYEAKQEDFEKIPGNPIAYWVSDRIKKIFDSGNLYLHTISEGQNKTSNNDKFLRFVWELGTHNTISKKYTPDVKWVFIAKGGSYRRWYGNIEYFINWSSKARSFYRKNHVARIVDEKVWFRKGITWTKMSSSSPANFRLLDINSTYETAGPAIFFDDKNISDFNYYLGFLNGKIANKLLNIFNPTMSFQTNDIRSLPIIFTDSENNKRTINILTQQNIDISKEEWDSRETSWDFAQNEILRILNDEFLMSNEKMPTLETVYKRYCEYWREKFFTLHKNEEELNRLFIDIYELQDELTPDVELKDITILKNEAKIVDDELVFQAGEIIKQFISYGVGVMFGRYSLDHEGLHIADTGVSLEEANAKFGIAHPTFEADDDNIIPIVDESDYFTDDMTDRFTEFVRITFGSEKLQQNIAFIEASLGKKLRAYFMKDFYIDHTKRYKKRPIYWLFSSPSATFQVLIYMHRYTPDTLNHILNDYLRPFRIRLESMRNEAMRITESEEVSPRDKTIADKKIDKIDKTLDDITEYEKLLDHYAKQRIEIDLDDGVKVNYCKFKELLFTFDNKLCK